MPSISTQCPNQRLIEYFDLRRDPVRYYFQEKVSNLFLKKEILSIVLGENPFERSPAAPEGKPERPKNPSRTDRPFVFPPTLLPNDTSIVSENCSEENASTKSDDSTPPLERGLRHSVLVRNYETDKISKKITTNLTLKMRGEKTRFEEFSERKIMDTMESIKEKDALIETSLTQQVSDIQMRVQSRKMNSIVKKSKNASLLVSRFEKSMLDALLKRDESTFVDQDGLGSILKGMEGRGRTVNDF
jgi:hypothetical protein